MVRGQRPLRGNTVKFRSCLDREVVEVEDRGEVTSNIKERNNNEQSYLASGITTRSVVGH